ncbi:MAG: phosphatidate cytidylyltransferase [Rhodothermales bacterium]
MSSGLLRVLTALVGAPLVIGAVVVGGVWFTGLIVIAGAICQLEYYGIGRATSSPLLVGLGIAAGACGAAGFQFPVLFVPALLLALCLLLLFPFTYHSERAVSVLAVLVSGIFYPALMLGTLVGVRTSAPEQQALMLTVLSIVLVWSSDTFAYYIGRAVGSHQLTPISPKKTWEGAVGGLSGAILVALLLKQLWLGDVFSWQQLVIVAFIAGGVGQLGDIFESKLKRAADVKDSGAILPGHGGMLDRLDAVIVVSPLIYTAFVLIPHVVAG